jgi:hypothetical protein
MGHMMRTIAALLAASALIAPASSAPPVFDANRVTQDVKVLSSDAYEGRGPATAAESKVIAYVIGQDGRGRVGARGP